MTLVVSPLLCVHLSGGFVCIGGFGVLKQDFTLFVTQAGLKLKAVLPTQLSECSDYRDELHSWLTFMCVFEHLYMCVVCMCMFMCVYIEVPVDHCPAYMVALHVIH